jgi:hypothetical protein
LGEEPDAAPLGEPAGGLIVDNFCGGGANAPSLAAQRDLELEAANDTAVAA